MDLVSKIIYCVIVIYCGIVIDSDYPMTSSKRVGIKFLLTLVMLLVTANLQLTLATGN